MATNPYAMNPFPVRSRRAQALKYPPGIETVAYWGDGRFEVSLDTFHDNRAEPSATFLGIRAMRQDGAMVYMVGQDGFLALDLSRGSYQKFATKEQIPAELLGGFKRVEDLNDPQNIVFDPRTRMPVR